VTQAEGPKDRVGYPRDGINESPTDTRRDYILHRLSEYFPSGATEKLAASYNRQLRKGKYLMRHVEEAIERIIHTREARTFPPFAILKKACDAVQSEELVRSGDSSRSTYAAWLDDDRVGTGRCKCEHGLGMHGPIEAGWGEPMLSGNCRNCGCGKYDSPQ